MATDKEIEAAGRSLAQTRGIACRVNFDTCTPSHCGCRHDANNALTAAESVRAPVPEGLNVADFPTGYGTKDEIIRCLIADRDAWKIMAKQNNRWNELPQSEKEATLQKALDDQIKETEELRTALRSPPQAPVMVGGAFNRGAREGWMRCGVYHVDIDFETRPQEQDEINLRWPLSASPPATARDETIVVGRDPATIEACAVAVRAACGMCMDGVADVDSNGDPIECEYCGRPMAAIRALSPPVSGKDSGQ